MKKFNLFLITYKFLIINSFIILYFITNFFDGNRGYFSFQKKKIEYDKLTNVEKLLNMQNKKLINENMSLSQNIDLNFLDEVYRKKFAVGKKNEKLLIIKWNHVIQKKFISRQIQSKENLIGSEPD